MPIHVHVGLSVALLVSDRSKDDNQIWFLFLVFVGVYLPELAMKVESRFIPGLEGQVSIS